MVLFLVSLANAVDCRGCGLRSDDISRVEVSDILELATRIHRRALKADLAYARLFAGSNGEYHLNLLGLRILVFSVRDGTLVIAVFLQKMLNILDCRREFVRRKQFTQLQLRCVHDLRLGRPWRSTFDSDPSDEEVWAGYKRNNRSTVCASLTLDFQIGEPAGCKHSAERLLKRRAVKNVPFMHPRDFPQDLLISRANSGKADFFNGAAKTGR